MKKVTTEIKLVRKNKSHNYLDQNNYDLIIQNLPVVKEEIIQQWVSNENIDELYLSCEIKSEFLFKTTSQLGYLHAAIFPVFYKHYESQGFILTDKLKLQIRNEVKTHEEINFVEQKTSIVNNKLYLDVKSFADASKEETSDIIDKIIRVFSEYGLIFESPEQYKKRKNIINFTE